MTHKNRKKFKKFHLLMSEGFSCSLYVLHGGLGINKLIFFLSKKIQKMFSCFFSSILSHQNPGSGLDPDQDSVNPDLQY
jgi:hypothetical protein